MIDPTGPIGPTTPAPQPEGDPNGYVSWVQTTLRDHDDFWRGLDMSADRVSRITIDEKNENVVHVPIGPRASEEAKRELYKFLLGNSSDLENFRLRYHREAQ
jgi:hypothetical protein